MISCMESTSLLSPIEPSLISSLDSECHYLDEREDQSRPLLTKTICYTQSGMFSAKGGIFSPVKDANVYMMTQSMIDTFYWLSRAYSK